VKLVDGIWLPDTDLHFAQMMRKEPTRVYGSTSVGVYQYAKLSKALAHTAGRRVALDIGAHVGFWSMWLAKEFDQVEAFEPNPDHAACWRENVRHATLHQCALGAAAGFVGMAIDQENSGKTHVAGEGEIQVATLDSFGFARVDLVKIDVEGYESAVIEGGRKTLLQEKPVVVVESNGQHSRYGLPDPVQVLKGMGAEILESMGKDYVMGWPC
jgi:FkbM family methyltransferase